METAVATPPAQTTTGTGIPMTGNLDASKIIFPGEKAIEPPPTPPVTTPVVTIETPKPADPPPAAATPPATSTTPDATTTPPVETVIPPAEVAPVEIEEHDVMELLNGATGLQIANIAEIGNIFNENKALKDRLLIAEKRELEFPTPQAKALYDFAVKFGGSEMTAAQTYLQAMSVDLDKADPKTIQMRAFLLSKPHLTEENGKEIFNAIYGKTFEEGWENDPLLKFEHDERTREAKVQIKKATDEFNKVVPPVGKKTDTPAVDSKQEEAITLGVTQYLKGFEGINIGFDETPEGTLSIDMAPEEAEAFKATVLNPQSFFDALIKDCLDENGRLDEGKYVTEMYEILNRKRLITEAQKFGLARGSVKILEQAKNTLRPDEIPVGNNGAPGPAKKTKEEVWVEAYQASLKK